MKWEMGSRKWEVGNGKSEVGSRKWEVGSGKSEVGSDRRESRTDEGGRDGKFYPNASTTSGRGEVGSGGGRALKSLVNLDIT